MTDDPATDELDTRLLLGRYRVVGRLGEGGMGTVHLARLEGAEGFMKPVVVKRMRRDIKATEEGNRLFRREATILSKMHHPSIVNIVDFGVEDGAHIMVLEYVHGYTLAPWLDYREAEKLPLPVDVCLYIMRRVLDALDFAHHFENEEGEENVVVHRDVAPDNILISRKGFVHLLDFGVASMSGTGRDNSTKAGVFRGKLGYAAPETVHGQSATPRCDQYSAAVVLLELLIQETPFVSDSMGETIQRMVGEIPPAPSARRGDIPDGLDAVLARALNKEPEQRFDSAAAFSRELRRLQQGDDEEVAALLKELVRQDFDVMPQKVDVEPLRARREALARKLPTGARAVQLDSVVADGERATLPTLGESAQSAPATTTGVAPSGNQKQLHGLLLGLLVVGGVIAVALGAAVALLSRSGTGEQVVVVGGDNPDVETEPTSAEPRSGQGDSQTEPTASEGNQAAPFAGEPEGAVPRAPAPSKPAAGSAPRAASKQQKLSRAVQSQSPAFQACFQSHVESGQEGASEATLRFSVPAQGGVAQVSVSPSGSSPLGQCLGRAARRVHFPSLGEAVSFSVPVRARVSRTP